MPFLTNAAVSLVYASSTRPPGSNIQLQIPAYVPVGHTLLSTPRPRSTRGEVVVSSAGKCPILTRFLGFSSASLPVTDTLTRSTPTMSPSTSLLRALLHSWSSSLSSRGACTQGATLVLTVLYTSEQSVPPLAMISALIPSFSAFLVISAVA